MLPNQMLGINSPYALLRMAHLENRKRTFLATEEEDKLEDSKPKIRARLARFSSESQNSQCGANCNSENVHQVAQWTVDDVCSFVESVEECQSYVQVKVMASLFV